MAPDLNSLPPSRSPISANGIDRRQPNPPSPRSGSFSLAAAATINAGMQQQDSRHHSASSRSTAQPNQPARSERRRSNVAMNLNLNDPSMPAPGEFQHSDRRPSTGHHFRTSSPQDISSPTTAPPHHRAPSLGELHQELEQEQEAQVNRLLEMIRQQQIQLQQMQQHTNYTPSTSTAAIDNSTPTSERSFSFPSVPASAPISMSNPRPRSPAPHSSFELSRQSSRQSRTPSRGGSPAVRPLSAGLQAHGDDWLLSGGNQGGRDDVAYYQAETQMLTRENQMLKMRIRELGPTLPTSSTGILSSSPPPQQSTRRPGLTKTASTLTERAPLSTVPSIELDEHGQTILMGRSSNSSHYQLSTNKLVSRVHVRAVYIPAEPPAPRIIRIECLGWNGVRVHCEHKAWTLQKGDSFTSETEDADIMVDVQDARVLLQWPRDRPSLVTPIDSESPWEELSPSREKSLQQRSPLQNPRRRVRLQSPISPSKAVQAVSSNPSLGLVPELNPSRKVEIYVDDDVLQEREAVVNSQGGATQSTQIATQPLEDILDGSQSSALSDPQEFSDNDEENDPVVHSFGPYGANLDSRMAAITANESPDRRRPALSPLKASSISPQRVRRTGPQGTHNEEITPVVNHVIGQLAYSRLASTPLSTIMKHIPSDLKATNPSTKENNGLTLASLKYMLNSTACIGEVSREGKDAAGKALESEFYYIPDMDADAKRRDAVVDGLQKPGLRACRKQHKQYYWRKPK
ncbi:MAG: hypothetical protein Q9220_003843 [cf. Caloplaca sp. 1 TL-2023]